jgi:threonine dehydratase
MSTEPEVPAIADVRLAAARIAGRAVATPLLSNAYLDERVRGRVLLKCETLQRTGSFKFRGACNAIAAIPAEERAKGVVAVSSGNHAQGVAEAARLFGIPATIVMPSDAPAIKRLRTERSGAVIVDYDRKTEDREAIAARILAERGGTLIHPYNDTLVIAGQGTIGLEIVADCERHGISPDAVLVPCGGGGLSAGVGLAIRSEFADTPVWLVEPEGFDDYARSLQAGRDVQNTLAAGSVCDALLAPSPGPIGFALNRKNASGAISVSDREALAAVAFAFRELKLVVEPGGAVALAALLAGRFDCRDRTVVAVLSGGNIDETMLQRALALG